MAIRESARKSIDRKRRLREQAGVAGLDEDGQWRDRREVSETKKALEGVFYTQMGLCRHRDGRYWADPVVLFPCGGFKELPEIHGVQFRVRDDAQAWFGWRRTIGGFSNPPAGARASRVPQRRDHTATGIDEFKFSIGSLFYTRVPPEPEVILPTEGASQAGAVPFAAANLGDDGVMVFTRRRRRASGILADAVAAEGRSAITRRGVAPSRGGA